MYIQQFTGWKISHTAYHLVVTLILFKRHFNALVLKISVFMNLLQAMSGFLMMLTQNGKLLYISDNAAEYLGHSMVSITVKNLSNFHVSHESY